jgi:uncharacterized phage-associated protein
MAEYIRFFTNPDKLSAAIVYLALRSLHDDHLGETKLVKLLYYADCAAYQRTGEPITGATYIHMDHGPYPDGWQAAIQDLEERGIVRVQEEVFETTGAVRKRWLPGENADSTALAENDRRLLDEQVRRFWEYTGGQIEAYSHDDLAWHATADRQMMPYELSGIRRPGPLDEETRARGLRILERIKKEGRMIARDVTPG